MEANSFICLCSRTQRAKSPVEKSILSSSQINELFYINLYERVKKKEYKDQFMDAGKREHLFAQSSCFSFHLGHREINNYLF